MPAQCHVSRKDNCKLSSSQASLAARTPQSNPSFSTMQCSVSDMAKVSSNSADFIPQDTISRVELQSDILKWQNYLTLIVSQNSADFIPQDTISRVELLLAVLLE